MCCPKPSPTPGGQDLQYCPPITPCSWLSVPGDCGSRPVLLVNGLRLGPVSSVLPKTLSDDSRGPGPTILSSYYTLFTTKCPRWLRQPACAAGGWPDAGSCEQCAAHNPLRLQTPGPTILPSYYSLVMTKCPRWLAASLCCWWITWGVVLWALCSPKPSPTAGALDPLYWLPIYTLFMTKCPRWLWQPACAAGGWPEVGSCEKCVAQNPFLLQGAGTHNTAFKLHPVPMTKCPRWLWQPACGAGGWPEGWVLWAVCCPLPSLSPGGRDPQYCLPITPYSWQSVPGDCGSQPVLLVDDLRLGPVRSVLPKTLSDSRGLDPQYWLPITPYSWLSVLGVAMANQRSFKIGSFRFAAFVPKKIEYIRFWNKILDQNKTFLLSTKNFCQSFCSGPFPKIFARN